jgi:hypothetical protein
VVRGAQVTISNGPPALLRSLFDCHISPNGGAEMLVLAVLALVLVWALVAVSQVAWWAEPGSARGSRSARPQVECLEGRWVPATFQWTPQKNSTDGIEAYNWTCITDGTHSVPPSDGTATLAFSSGYKNGNNSCYPTGTNYSTISPNSGYLGTITLKSATTVGSAYLSGGTSTRPARA